MAGLALSVGRSRPCVYSLRLRIVAIYQNTQFRRHVFLITQPYGKQRISSLLQRLTYHFASQGHLSHKQSLPISYAWVPLKVFAWQMLIQSCPTLPFLLRKKFVPEHHNPDSDTSVLPTLHPLPCSLVCVAKPMQCPWHWVPNLSLVFIIIINLFI